VLFGAGRALLFTRVERIMTKIYTLNGFRITEDDRVSDQSEGEDEEILDFRPAVLTLQFPSDVTSITYSESVFTYPRGSNLGPDDPSDTDIFIEIPQADRIAIDGENIDLIHSPLDGLFEFLEVSWSGGTSQAFGFYYDDAITGSFFDNEFSYDYVFPAAGAELPSFATYDDFVAWAASEGLGDGPPPPQPTGAFAAGQPIPLSAFDWDAVTSLTEPLTVAGTAAAETLAGGTAADTVEGRAGDDFIRADAGDDVIAGGDGSDTLDGGAGVDTAVWDGAAGDYILTLGSLAVTEKGGGAADVVKNVELLQFGDGFGFGAEGAIDYRLIEGVQEISAEEMGRFVEMYIAYFDRAPDALGLFYWGTRLADDMSIEQIAASFFEQDETRERYPDEGDFALLVDAGYRNLLERDPDAEGRAYWIEQLELGNVTRGQFMLDLISGTRGEGGSAADVRTVEDKAAIGIDYAVINGLTDVDNAIAAMQAYDAADAAASLAEAEALIDGYRAAAESGAEIVVELTGVVDDPFAAA
jgi:hypothetical protein